MSLSKEIEDSLRACREIQEQLAHDDAWNTHHATEPDTEEIEEEREPAQDPGALETAEEVPVSEAEEKENAKDAETAAGHPLLKTLLSIVICIFTALILAFLITRYAAHHTSVEGSSMETALADGDQIIVEKISYYFHDPQRYDIIVFSNQERVNYIKRIIGLPGETVQIAEGIIFINGEALLESYGSEWMEDSGLAAEEILLGEDEYFVLGDNRNASIDSRRPEVGTVKRDQIRGRAWFRFYPFSKAGSIK